MIRNPEPIELEETAEKLRTILLNPNQLDLDHLDTVSQTIMQKTVEFFENKGKKHLLHDNRHFVWYADFLEFVKENEVFANLLTPPTYGDNTRWDTRRNCNFNEILGFYGLAYWYTWQVSILGLGPIWMSDNEAVKQQTAQLLRDGGIFAFGLSEQHHGADIYSSSMTLSPQEDGTYLASGKKYYIGNGNKAALVSVFGKIEGTNDYVFFVVESGHEKFELHRNVVNSQSYVAEFALNKYPITEAEILATGQDAWNLALNTVNVGKYNLGWASIGISTHAFYEAINHASNRSLYKMMVTDFPHVQQMFVDGLARLTAMKLFALRASDYIRSASDEDRRYLLYAPIVKMMVTTEGERVIDLLWDVIAAKGFENSVYFDMAARDIRALPKLEGTVHVNIALIVKFMANYFFNPGDLPEIPTRLDAAHDDYMFNQAPTRGLSRIQFHDYQPVFEAVDLPNVNIFQEQIEVFRGFLMKAGPDDLQRKDVDFLLAIGRIFTLIVYAQLILENAKVHNIEDGLLDQIFDVFVRDFSEYALAVYSKSSASEAQMSFCLKMIRHPHVDRNRFETVWSQVMSLKDLYEMRP